MTSAPVHGKRGTIAFVLGAMMLLSTTLPFASVLAANEAGEADGLVVLVYPRHGTLVDDDKLAMAASDNMFIFDFELRHPDGSPYFVTEYGVDVHTIDGRLNASAEWPTLIWEGRFPSAEPIYKGTIRVPASEVVFFTPKDPNGYYHEMPFGGMSFTILATKDADGNSLLDGSYPAGQYSLLANNAYASGVRGNELDLADETFTPILLFNGQLSGLLQFGNPVLNPGFEIGYEDNAVLFPPVGQFPGFTSSIPPWVLLNTADGSKPASTVHIQGAAGSSGSAAAIRYNTADNGKTTAFGQLFFVPGSNAPGPYVGTESVQVKFDMRARDENNLLTTPFHGAVTLHWNDSTLDDGDAQLTKTPVNGVPLDNVWRSYSLDYGAAANASQLNSLFFSMNNAGYALAGSQLVVEIDNVRIVGAKIGGGVPTTRNDMTDGYSTFVTPFNGLVTENVAMRLAKLADGSEAYVFRLSAMDYSGIDIVPVDVASNAVNLFQLLSQNNLQAEDRHNKSKVAFHADTNGENATAFYHVLNPDGTASNDLVIVVPGEFADQTLVPWFLTKIPTDASYTSTFGPEATPAGAFYSIERNNLQFTHLADSLDYAFDPIAFLDQAGGSVAAPTSVSVFCPAQAANIPCATPGTAATLEVTVLSESAVAETITVELYSEALAEGNASFPDGVVASATVAVPGGKLTMTLNETVTGALAEVGNLSVVARTSGALFAADATAPFFELDNLLPTANFSGPADLVNVTARQTVTFTDTSTDSDGVIKHRLWQAHMVADFTPDADPTPDGTLIRSGNASTFSFQIPDDGLYRVTLAVGDDGGAWDTKVLEFNVTNRAPVITITGPAFGLPDTLMDYTYTIDDIDGLESTTHEVCVNTVCYTGATVPTALPVAAAFTDNGTHTISVTASDDDGDIGVGTFTVLIESTPPLTTITSLAGPVESGGFWDGPASYNVTRMDVDGGNGTSGVASTVVTIVTKNGGQTSQIVPGDAPFQGIIDLDGNHTVFAYSIDNAGNVGPEVSTTVLIDRSKPFVNIASPQLLDGDSPIEGVFFTDQQVTLVANATDDHSGIAKVEFFVDGGDAVGVDTDGSDGWSLVWTAAGTGTHEVAMVATNGAGLKEISETITIVVI